MTNSINISNSMTAITKTCPLLHRNTTDCDYTHLYDKIQPLKQTPKYFASMEN